MSSAEPIWIYTIPEQPAGPVLYDHALAAACFQGLINRETPCVYLHHASSRSGYWLDRLSGADRWLSGRAQVPVSSLDALRELAGDRCRGAVIWDPAVPATVNVATTFAGVHDAVVLSPELADTDLARWGLRVLLDLRGRFDGSDTGSAKNDAYRWAVDEFIRSGCCSSHFLHLYEDSYAVRDAGDVKYVLTRDWSVFHRAFVYDLSPWGDEAPEDDPGQALGTDLATYHQILGATLERSAGREMTEVSGFFNFAKYSNIKGHPSLHEPVPTEWETVHLISPYNCYQNTVAHLCLNQSFHCQAPVGTLRQRPAPQVVPAVEDKTYLCLLMADYDSATPLYDFMPRIWDDPRRGEIPVVWGINPNLMETYPDLFAHLYDTATPNDVFGADASAAGYMNPNRVRPEFLDLFIRHNKHFFERADMSLAPMVLDWTPPTSAVLDAFTEFAPNGYASILMNFHEAAPPEPVAAQVWKGMPVTELINDVCDFHSIEETVDSMDRAIRARGDECPGFYFFRIIWTPPSRVLEVLARLREKHPRDYEVLNPYTFFRLAGAHSAT